MPFHRRASIVRLPRAREEQARPRQITESREMFLRMRRNIYARDSIERGVAAREPVGQRFCVHLQLTGLSADCARRNRARACSATFLASLLHVFLSPTLEIPLQFLPPRN